MSRRGNKGTPDNEVEEAAQRMRKHPEHLRAARTSREWQNFLLEIGIHSNAIESERGSAFWEKVRERTIELITGFAPQTLAEKNVEVILGIFRDKEGHFTKVVTNSPVISYRNKETGRFVSKKSLTE